MSCASPAYLKRHGVPKHPSELEDGHHTIRYVSSRNGKLYSFNMFKDGEVIEAGGRHQLAVNDSNAGVTAALAGLGVLHTLTFLVQDHIASGALEPLFPGWCTEAKPIHVVYPPNRHLSNKVRVFVDWVAELFAKHDLIHRKSSLTREMCTGWPTHAPREQQTPDEQVTFITGEAVATA
jgi:DNA-binding transcriptional LysR family regulator